MVSQTIQVSLPVAGTWFDYLQNTSFTATGTVQNITMQPGEFHVYLNRNVNNITVTPVTSLPGNALALEAKTYPNPSQSSLMVDISMPQSQQVRIEVFATTGQYISTLYNRFLPRGNHTLNLNRPALARGSYFMKITTKNATKTLPVTFQ